MNIVAFGASTSTTSINKALATFAASLIESAEVTVLDLNDYQVPLFSEDCEKADGLPSAAKQFLADLSHADALVISFAEHNGHYPAAFKNLFDWATRINREVYQHKPAVYLATSPGPGGAASVLAAATKSAQFFGGDVRASVSIPSFYDNFDLSKGEITNPDLLVQVQEAVAKLSADCT